MQVKCEKSEHQLQSERSIGVKSSAAGLLSTIPPKLLRYEESDPCESPKGEQERPGGRRWD